MKRVSVVFYAVNGTGTGHLTRLLAIARWMRRHSTFLGVQLDAVFLTTSEADRLAFDAGFPSFKIPSKTLVRESGMDPLAYRALAKQWVWHTLGLMRPRLLVVDTFPRGSFGELGPALDLVESKAFVYRPTRPEVAERPDFQAMLPLYDLLLVPAAEGASLPAPESARDRMVEVGPIVSIDAMDLLPRDAARASLGVPLDASVVLVTSGGGGDRSLDLAATARALVDDGHWVVIGAGPLFRGPAISGPHIVFSREPGLATSLRAFDAAVSAAGYNTFHELSLAGVPTAYVPQHKLADDQVARATAAAAAGVAVVADPGVTPADLPALVASLRALPKGPPLVARSHARDASSELLRLVLPPADVDRAALAVDDLALSACDQPKDERAWLQLLGLVVRGHALDTQIIRCVAAAARGDISGALAVAEALLWKRGGRPRERAAWLERSLPHARALGPTEVTVRLIRQVSAQRGATEVPAALASWAERSVSAIEALGELAR